MGFWSSFRDSKKGSETPAPSPAAEPLSPSAARLLAFGSAGGPGEEEAVRLLATLRVSAEEGLALDALARLASEHTLPERLVLAAASAFVDRGDRMSARSLLAGYESTGALLQSADLSAEDGDFPLAVATIERVLLRDLDVPGASERRQRWRARLGLTEALKRVDPATMTIATARPRAPFNLLGEVARGGAGVVYEATDRELGRKVALKLYHRPDRDRAQLMHEARVATSLEGRGIVRVFDVQPDEGWLALEWAPSGAIRELLRPEGRARLPPLESWLPLLAEALAHVHAAGWVHHDVKPANVLMSAALTPWLADFGSARREGEPSPPGSLGYESPERLAGRPSNPRDDIYGFGRIVEDSLSALGGDLDHAAHWRRVSLSCVGPSAERPADGAALVSVVRDW